MGGKSNGGSKNGTVLAHFSKPEIAAMTQLQGHSAFDKETGAHDFTSLGKDLEHPLVGHMFHKHAVQHFASGGHLNQTAHAGRFGDNAVAKIPMSLASKLDSYIGGPSINPTTGHREYFSLGGLMSGIGKVGSTIGGHVGNLVNIAKPAIGNIGNTIRNGISTAGQQIARHAPAVMGHLGNIAGQLAPVAVQYGAQYLQNKLNPQQAPQVDPNQMFQDATGSIAGNFGDEGSASRNMYEGARTGASNLIQGGNLRSAVQQGVGRATDGYDNPYANTARGMADAYGTGSGMGDTMAHGINAGTRNMDNMYGRAAQGMSRSYLQGNGMDDMVAHGINSGSQGMDNSYGRAAQRMSQNYLEGNRDPRSMISSGMRGAMQGYDTPYANTGRAMLDTMDEGGGFGDMASQGMRSYGQQTQNPYAEMAGMAGQVYGQGRGGSGAYGYGRKSNYQPQYDQQDMYGYG